MSMYSSSLRTFFALTASLLLLTACGGDEKKGQDKGKDYETKTKKDRYGNEYQYVTNDPYDARIYELDNGLKVYLTANKEEPRVQTLIAVRAGSASEQRETTGLAHYLEHMLFKGSKRMGTLNWEKEKPLLDSISALYEKRMHTQDSAQRRKLYQKIDSLSQVAAQYAIPNEYDKIIASLGGEGTNAFTSKDRTVYMNDIPSNEIEKWIRLERERFGTMVLRLFHTELETVFEEFNRGQDNDYRKASKVLDRALYKGHPYQLTTIGKPEHLKNPSMVNVHAFKDKFYAPNNLAICLSGDIDPAETFKTIKEHWGDMEPNKDLAEGRDLGEAKPIKGPVEKTVQGPEAARVYVAYRFPSNDSVQPYVDLLSELLYNGQAGLIDLNLEKQQKVLNANCYSSFYKEYGTLRFFGQARPGQSLEEVRDLLLEQVNKLRKGDYAEWMLEAVIRNKKKEQIQQRSSNQKAFAFVEAFIQEEEWVDQVNYLDRLSGITKEELTAFAREHLDSNYVVVYKRSGEDTSSVKMPKPPITPVNINRGKRSDFWKEIDSMESQPVQPVFVDYDKVIDSKELSSGIKLNYTTNKENELFTLYYLLEMGDDHDKELSLAVEYLDKIGTDKYTSSELEQEFYKLGTSFGVRTRDDHSYIYVNGLPEAFEESVELLEHVIQHAQKDTTAYTKMVNNKLQKRENNKKSKQNNLIGLFNYGLYGPHSNFTDKLSKEKLRSTDPAVLIDKIHHMYDHEHELYYHGQRGMNETASLLEKLHPVKEDLKSIPEKTEYETRDPQGDSVFFVNYDMVQSQVLLVSRGQEQDKELFPYAQMYNNYYGSGLSSVVFQEIRESKGLAYSSSSGFTTPDTGDYHFTYAFLGTQSDKTRDAIDVMKGLLDSMPRSEDQFEASRKNILKSIETNRITGTDVFWNHRSAQKQGFEGDPRKFIYNKVKGMSLDDLNAFFNKHVKNGDYDLLIVTNRENIPPTSLSNYGKVKEIDRETLFGY